MTHPACCRDPESCDLSYADHLRGFGLSATAIPHRAVTRTKAENGVRVPDEPTAQTLIREKRWERDMPAFKRLAQQGLTPPQIDGSALREREGRTVEDITRRRVTIDYSDPS